MTPNVRVADLKVGDFFQTTNGNVYKLLTVPTKRAQGKAYVSCLHQDLDRIIHPEGEDKVTKLTREEVMEHQHNPDHRWWGPQVV